MADTTYTDMTDDELRSTQRAWSAWIDDADGWGVSPVFAIEQRDAAHIEMDRRGVTA